SSNVSQPSENGRLGVTFDRAEYETAGRFKITSVIPLGPAAVSKQIKVGEYIVSVDGTPLRAGANLDEQLMHKVGRRVELGVSASGDGMNPRTVVVQPVSGGAERQLLYCGCVWENMT